MKAIIFDGAENKLVDGVTVREPGAGDVLVRIVASGVCQSDLNVVNGKIPFPTPVVLGHEGAGVVEAVGPGVTAPAVGDHVVLATLATCGHCRHCASGHPTMCRESIGKVGSPFQHEDTAIHNFATLGTFSERVVVRAQQAITIPKDVPLTSACMIGCAVLTGAGAVFNRAKVQAGETVVVIGAGGIGLNVIQAARIAGAVQIIVIDTNTNKEAKAREFGATHFVDAFAGNTVETILQLTGDGANHVFDCVGGEAITSQAIEMVAWGGQLIMLGVAGPETKLSVLASALYMDRSVLGCRYGSSRPGVDVLKYIELYQAGKLLLDELVTKEYDFDDYETLVDDALGGRLDRGVLVMSAA
ncbi:S-(hydroxymethyl)glutathione dehydrogenase/alcohol dehydrogenase [Leucobacter exalbidus]|uniref:S-(Hydroxymethyl)glutathione dehydrogenase/alcohol dehydrogenase n=1 Tax=Leucobacter exalbidus TaxID=662960 RepID=A0A940PMT6_9MICO|nr:Zn-dependent alcohol dehydrogenase [Leucobacter exalbidus]MBP1325975.1 S-(hydroxymethyl)glutathione dehydrogenase/alcohol dehydrogenase [Leucobacter exalbidus]